MSSRDLAWSLAAPGSSGPPSSDVLKHAQDVIEGRSPAPVLAGLGLENLGVAVGGHEDHRHLEQVERAQLVGLGAVLQLNGGLVADVVGEAHLGEPALRQQLADALSLGRCVERGRGLETALVLHELGGADVVVGVVHVVAVEHGHGAARVGPRPDGVSERPLGDDVAVGVRIAVERGGVAHEPAVAAVVRGFGREVLEPHWPSCSVVSWDVAA